MNKTKEMLRREKLKEFLDFANSTIEQLCDDQFMQKLCLVVFTLNNTINKTNCLTQLKSVPSSLGAPGVAETDDGPQNLV